MEKDELTYKIIGCAMRVHNTLGNGFQEVIYQRCLAIEFEKAEINFEREVEQSIFYQGINVFIIHFYQGIIRIVTFLTFKICIAVYN